MAESVTEVRPDGAESGVCRSCRTAVWWATTVEGGPIALDLVPDVDGDVEMTRVGGEWRAGKLLQVECLFDVDRTRWRAHATTCPRRRAAGRGRVPAQRTS